jgi:hypothetical protein
VTALVGAALTSCTTTRPVPPPSPAQITALLVRHATAVRTHSSSRFLADIDPSGAASAFRRAQSAEIADIGAVPLQSWTYRIGSIVDDPAATAVQSARYGAPARIVDVQLSYAFSGVDPVATVHELYWTFVSQHGHTYLAGDDALARAGGVSYVGPWDFGPVIAAHGRSSLVLGHPAQRAQLAALAATADAAIPVVTGVWGSDWVRRVTVFVPSSTAELTGLVGSAAPDVSADTVFDTDDPVNGTRYGQRIVLNPAVLPRLTPVGRRIVVQHEIAHVASGIDTTAASPRWLIEGFAEYVGNLGSGQRVPTAAAELARQVARGELPSALPVDADFANGAAELPPVYEQSWLACRLIAERAGPAGLVRLYRLVGASADGPDAAVQHAVQSVLHESLAGFLVQWRRYLRTELG